MQEDPSLNLGNTEIIFFSLKNLIMRKWRKRKITRTSTTQVIPQVIWLLADGRQQPKTDHSTRFQSLPDAAEARRMASRAARSHQLKRNKLWVTWILSATSWKSTKTGPGSGLKVDTFASHMDISQDPVLPNLAFMLHLQASFNRKLNSAKNRLF